MRSSTFLTLMAALGPAAVLSSPRPPPGWVVEIITVSFDTARFAHHPPHVPGATTTAADASLGSGEPTGTLTDLSPTITSEPEPGSDECENEGSSSLSFSDLATYPTASGSLSLSSSSFSSMTSSLTTLSTIPVAAKNRRQVDSPPTTTTTSALGADTSIPAGVTAPDGYAGTAGYPASVTSATDGLPSITPGGVKKVKGSGCAKGPGGSVSKSAGSGSMTASGDVYGGATISSSSMMSSATGSATAVGM